MSQYPSADPTISASLNHSWPVIHQWFFSSLAGGISHSFTDTQSTTERVEEKNKRTNTDLGQLQVQEGEKSQWHSLCILLANTSVYSRKISHKATRNGDLNSRVGYPGICGSKVLAAAFLTSVDLSPLCPTLISLTACSVDWSLLLPSAEYPLGPSFPRPFGLVGDLERKLFVWISNQNKGILWLAPTHRETNATRSVTIWH